MKQVLVGVIILGLLGGCQMSQGDSQENVGEEEKPDVLALQDEYTHEHLVSTEQTEDGFYTMEGDSGKFRMLFPENAVLSSERHRVEEDVGESMQYGEDGKERNYFVAMTYQDGVKLNNAELRFKSLSNSVNYEGEPEIKEDEEKRIYFGKTIHELEYSNGVYYVYFSYIFSKQSDQALEMQYSVSCEGENCEEDLDLDREDEHALKLMESVEFQQP